MGRELRSICGEGPGDGGQTVLHAAVWIGSLEVVQLLLAEDGVDLRAETQCGFTPLHYAATLRSADLCKVLVENGADHEMGTVVSKYARCRLVGCLHGGTKPFDFDRLQSHFDRCGGMPVDNAHGEAKEYLESLHYSRRGQVAGPAGYREAADGAPGGSTDAA